MLAGDANDFLRRGMMDPRLSSVRAQRGGWRGDRSPARAPARRRWQRDWTTQTQRESQRGALLRRLRFGGSLAVCVALIALLVYVLTYAPRQTPMLVIFAPAYEAPLPPLAWSQEDAARLAALDGQILAIEDDSEAWRTLDRGLRSLPRQLRRLAERGSARDGVIIYLAMHGAVDDSGRPCLIPPGASPLASETWLPVGDLIARIEQTPDLKQRPKLLVIDAVRQLTNPNAGVLYNTFAQRVTELIEETRPAGLAVLLSVGAGERSWVSRDMEGAVFAHFFQQGLAGGADQPEFGNADRSVSLHELSRYLRRRVNAWAGSNRAAVQQPLLLPADAADIHVTWAMSNRSRSRLNAQPTTRTASPAPAINVNALWLRRDALDIADARRFAPLAWRDFEHKLLWLEQATEAGAAYASQAAAAAGELDAWLTEVEGRVAAASQPGNLAMREMAFRG
ncbi:MAG: caspase family protein, partial [Planctomycetes bacterium]|nr:caspase family protein [Planctomycetota bacterium]